MLNVKDILKKQYDFHIFIMELRNGDHYVGNLYQTKNKAESIAKKYIKDDPQRCVRAYVIKVGTDMSNIHIIDNDDFIEDPVKAAVWEKDRLQEFRDNLWNTMGINND